jgi:acyl-coenzyme A synthetase/AMP-(fatty) acid ligase
MLTAFPSHFTDNTLVEFNMTPQGWMGGTMYYVFLTGRPRVTIDFRASGGKTPENITDMVWRCLQDEGCTKSILSPKYLPQLSSLAEHSPESRKLKLLTLLGMPMKRCMIRAALTLAEEVMVVYSSMDFGTVSLMTVRD